MTDPERNNLGNIIRQVYQQWLMSNNVYREDPSLTNDSMLSDLRLNAILVLGEVENIRSKITTSERQLVSMYSKYRINLSMSPLFNQLN